MKIRIRPIIRIRRCPGCRVLFSPQVEVSTSTASAVACEACARYLRRMTGVL